MSSSRLRTVAWTCCAIAAGTATYWIIGATRGGLPKGLPGITVVFFPVVSLLFALQTTRYWRLGQIILLPALYQLLGGSLLGTYRASSSGQWSLPWVATVLVCFGLFVGFGILVRRRKAAAQPGVEPD